jgi:hypothetical protein
MKAKLFSIISLIALLALQSCHNNHEIEPAGNNLLGTWSSVKNGYTWSIENTIGVGYDAKFTELDKADGRYLQVNIPAIPINDTYKVSNVDALSLILISSKGDTVSFARIR